MSPPRAAEGSRLNCCANARKLAPETICCARRSAAWPDLVLPRRVLDRKIYLCQQRFFLALDFLQLLQAGVDFRLADRHPARQGGRHDLDPGDFGSDLPFEGCEGDARLLKLLAKRSRLKVVLLLHLADAVGQFGVADLDVQSFGLLQADRFGDQALKDLGQQALPGFLAVGQVRGDDDEVHARDDVAQGDGILIDHGGDALDVLRSGRFGRTWNDRGGQRCGGEHKRGGHTEDRDPGHVALHDAIMAISADLGHGGTGGAELGGHVRFHNVKTYRLGGAGAFRR